MEPNSRVKTVDTACDKLLSQKINLASKLAEVLYTAGASRVTIRDLRESPHSGYRADTEVLRTKGNVVCSGRRNRAPAHRG